MKRFPRLRRCRPLRVLLMMVALTASLSAADPKPHESAATSGTSLARFISALRDKARVLESSAGMRQGFQSFTSKFLFSSGSVRYSDYVIARLFFEGARDAGFWNIQWTITNKEPNSDEIWRQWKSARLASLTQPTAIAECDELSALYAFLVGRAGVRGVGLFWPTFNHTVAVWVIHPAHGPDVRVVVPTSQIFLDEKEMFGTRKFDPWRQKRILEYVRRDVPDTFVIPRPLFNFFLLQVDKYAGASDLTLQQIRYLREGVFRDTWTPEMAARKALKLRSSLADGSKEDLAAFQHFASDMRSGLLR